MTHGLYNPAGGSSSSSAPKLELSELTVTGTVSVEHKKDDNCGGSFVY